MLDRLARLLPVSTVPRTLLVKDLRVFLRDVTQWSQLLLLCALVLVYLYNFRVLDLDRIPYMRGVVRNIYAFLNLGLAGLVMSTVCVRFVFPAVSAEGAAFWIIRTAPIKLRDFLWSKFWTGVFPVFLLTEILTVAGNELMGIDPFLKVVTAGAIAFMTVVLVGLAAGLGARYPRFDADDATQVSGSYGGVMFMIVAVFYVLVTIALIGWPSSVYLMATVRQVSLSAGQQLAMGACFLTGMLLSIATGWVGMRSGPSPQRHGQVSSTRPHGWLLGRVLELTGHVAPVAERNRARGATPTQGARGVRPAIGPLNTVANKLGWTVNHEWPVRLHRDRGCRARAGGCLPFDGIVQCA